MPAPRPVLPQDLANKLERSERRAARAAGAITHPDKVRAGLQRAREARLRRLSGVAGSDLEVYVLFTDDVPVDDICELLGKTRKQVLDAVDRVAKEDAPGVHDYAAKLQRRQVVKLERELDAMCFQYRQQRDLLEALGDVRDLMESDEAAPQDLINLAAARTAAVETMTVIESKIFKWREMLHKVGMVHLATDAAELARKQEALEEAEARMADWELQNACVWEKIREATAA